MPRSKSRGQQSEAAPVSFELSEDPRVNELLNKVFGDLKAYTDKQRAHLKNLADIGIALSAEKNLTKLLEMIVDEARRFTNADGGTLYLVDEEEKVLQFEIVQNESMGTRMGGATGEPINWPPVPLVKKDGSPNHENVSASVAITAKAVNISDVYEVEGFNFEGTRKFDAGTGYRSKSMVVISMLNHENDTIGVLQLINATDAATKETIPFREDLVDLTSSLASQAAVAITNVRLVQDLENLFDAFIKSMATAIDEKSPYTAGHIARVTELTLMLANRVNEIDYGPYGDLQLDADELNELRIAAWMHDIGKVTTPVHVVDKANKLEKIFDRVELVALRFALIEESLIKEWQEKRLELYSNGMPAPSRLKKLDKRYEGKLDVLREEASFVSSCNEPGEFMEDEKIERLKKIAAKRYTYNGERRPYLSKDEVVNLSIKRGSLNAEDRKIIENHAMVTIKMLGELPFTKKLKRVPEYAGGHHEKLDGTGYPLGLTAEQLPPQARMMAIADIFEALTAHDRPYKKPMKLSKAVQILGFMAKDNHIDADLLEVFIKEKLHEEYASRHMDPSQID